MNHTTPRILSRGIATIAAALGAWALPHSAKAASGDWNIDANTTGWSVSTNWLKGIIAGGTAGDIANLNCPLTAARTSNLDGDRVVGSSNISPTAAFAYS